MMFCVFISYGLVPRPRQLELTDWSMGFFYQPALLASRSLGGVLDLMKETMFVKHPGI
jgi:hypothetical protein